MEHFNNPQEITNIFKYISHTHRHTKTEELALNQTSNSGMKITTTEGHIKTSTLDYQTVSNKNPVLIIRNEKPVIITTLWTDQIPFASWVNLPVRGHAAWPLFWGDFFAYPVISLVLTQFPVEGRGMKNRHQMSLVLRRRNNYCCEPLDEILHASTCMQVGLGCTLLLAGRGILWNEF